MKVLEPLRTQSSPSRSAVLLSAARSEPPLGSVIAIAVIVVPEQKPGSQRCFCSCVPSSTRYGATQSVWIPKQEDAAALNLESSSAKIALKRKSPAAEPP